MCTRILVVLNFTLFIALKILLLQFILYLWNNAREKGLIASGRTIIAY